MRGNAMIVAGFGAALGVAIWIVSSTSMLGREPAAAPAAPQPAGTPRIGEIPEDLIAKRLTTPVTGATPESLTSQFYDSRSDSGHEALDIAAATGTPVVAVEDGTIAKLFTSKAGGLTIYQFDPTETYTYY